MDIFMEEDFCDGLPDGDWVTGDDTRMVDNVVAATGTSDTLDEPDSTISGRVVVVKLVSEGSGLELVTVVTGFIAAEVSAVLREEEEGRTCLIAWTDVLDVGTSEVAAKVSECDEVDKVLLTSVRLFVVRGSGLDTEYVGTDEEIGLSILNRIPTELFATLEIAIGSGGDEVEGADEVEEEEEREEEGEGEVRILGVVERVKTVVEVLGVVEAIVVEEGMEEVETWELVITIEVRSSVVDEIDDEDLTDEGVCVVVTIRLMDKTEDDVVVEGELEVEGLFVDATEPEVTEDGDEEAEEEDVVDDEVEVTVAEDEEDVVDMLEAVMD